MDTVRETKRADELKEGDWTAPGGISALAAEVLHTLTYPHPGDGGSRTHLVLRESGITLPFSETYAADKPIGIATAEELESIRAGAERAQKIADIRALASYLETNPWMPMPYSLHSQTHGLTGDDVPMVRQLAERAGKKVDESRDDRTDFDLHFGCADFTVIAWHPGGRPAEPKPLVDPDASMEAHYDAEADAPHPGWPTGAELKPWETLAPFADRIAESMEPADPAGLVDETPVEPVHMEFSTGESMCGLATVTPHRGSHVWREVTCQDCIKAGS